MSEDSEDPGDSFANEAISFHLLNRFESGILNRESEIIMPFLHLNWYFSFFQGCFFGVAAMALHESAHIATALALGLRIKKVGLNWKGIYTMRETGPANKSLLVALAGPLINLTLIATWHWLPNFGLANFCFAVFNLLPITGSDGERALKLLDGDTPGMSNHDLIVG